MAVIQRSRSFAQLLSMRSHHFRQEIKHPPPLVDDIQELLLRPDAPNDNLVATLDQTVVRLVTELGERHSECSSLILAHVVV